MGKEREGERVPLLFLFWYRLVKVESSAKSCCQYKVTLGETSSLARFPDSQSCMWPLPQGSLLPCCPSNSSTVLSRKEQHTLWTAHRNWVTCSGHTVSHRRHVLIEKVAWSASPPAYKKTATPLSFPLHGWQVLEMSILASECQLFLSCFIWTLTLNGTVCPTFCFCDDAHNGNYQSCVAKEEFIYITFNEPN